jgi:subtilisin family serine protease
MRELLGVEAAWRAAGDIGSSCSIGIVDTGFDFFHPALRDALRPAFYADGVYHMSAASLQAHGTAVAGLILARPEADESAATGLARGCTGVAASIGSPIHELLMLRQRLRRENPEATEEDMRRELLAHAAEIQSFALDWARHVVQSTAAGIRSLVARGVKVVNLSLYLPTMLLSHTPDALEDLEEAIAVAQEQDVLLVIGAGNNGELVPDYPGEPDQLLVVGATLLDDTRWDTTAVLDSAEVHQGSNRSPQLDVVAPSQDLRVLKPHEPALYALRDTPLGAPEEAWSAAYGTIQTGATSMATAVVSSLAGLIRARRPDLSAADVAHIITSTAVDLGPPGWDEGTGHGRIDFEAALAAAVREER